MNKTELKDYIKKVANRFFPEFIFISTQSRDIGEMIDIQIAVYHNLKSLAPKINSSHNINTTNLFCNSDIKAEKLLIFDEHTQIHNIIKNNIEDTKLISETTIEDNIKNTISNKIFPQTFTLLNLDKSIIINKNRYIV